MCDKNTIPANSILFISAEIIINIFKLRTLVFLAISTKYMYEYDC